MNQADPSSGPRTTLEICVVTYTNQLSIHSTLAHIPRISTTIRDSRSIKRRGDYDNAPDSRTASK